MDNVSNRIRSNWWFQETYERSFPIWLEGCILNFQTRDDRNQGNLTDTRISETTRRRWKTKKYKNDRSKTSRPVSALSQIHIDESLHFTYVILHISRDYWKIGRDKWLLKSKTTEQESTTSFTNWFSYEEDRN